MTRQEPFRLARRDFIRAGLAGGATFLVASPAFAADAFSPGTRLTWFGGSASLPGERSQLEPDINGNWVNRQTGERYSESENPGPAGAGFGTIDILNAQANQTLLWRTLTLLHIDAGNAVSFIDADGLVPDGNNLFDYWMPPATLAQMPDQTTAGFQSVRMPYAAGGRTYRAIGMKNNAGNGWSQHIYDLDSGICLACSSSSQGAAVLTPGPNGQAQVGNGYTQLAFQHFVGARITNLPGPGAVLPPQIRQLRTVSYQGNRIVNVPGSPPFPMPTEARYDMVGGSVNMLKAKLATTGSVMPVDRIIAAGPIGSLWMDPTTLSRYGGQTVIDQDPATGVRAVALGQQNGMAVVGLQTPLAQQIYGYDLRSGLLMEAEFRDQLGTAETDLSMRLANAQ